MTDPTNDSLSDRLLAADAEGSPAPSAAPDLTLRDIVRREDEHERRVRRAALIAWATTLACIFAIGISILLIRNTGGMLVEVTRAALVVATLVGLISFLAASLASLAWLFRSRTPTLRAIERRLGTLEDSLRH